MSKICIFLSDLHIGGTTGLLPPAFVTFEGNEIKQNEYQKWLWLCWLDCWKWADHVIGKDKWICVLNGDLIDGFHHMTREVVSVDPSDHSSGAIDLLEKVLKGAAEVYVSEGTHVHTGNQEHSIASMLVWRGINVVKHNKKKSAWPELSLRVHGSLVCVDHHVATTSRSYLEAGAYSGTLGDMRNRRSRAGMEVPKLVVRSHRHQFGYFDDGYGAMVILPPWQGATRFTRRVVPGIVPQCGMVLADWRNVEYAGIPVIHRRIHTCK